MKQRDLLPALILVTSLALDQFSKIWARNLPTLHYNQGFFMGIYSELPDSLRVVALGCFAGIVFFIYVFLMYIIPTRARLLKYGLSLLVGGMFGNVVDKVVHGKTIDFIPFNYFEIYTVFNVADIFLWIGAGLILMILIGREKLVWYPDSVRGNYLISPKEQLKVGLNFALMVFSCSIVLGIFSYAFFKTTLPVHLMQKDNLMLTYFVTYVLMTLLLCTLAFVTGIISSHKSVGPLYAFEIYVNDLIKGQDRKLTFRDGDNYRELEQVAERLRSHFNKFK